MKKLTAAVVLGLLPGLASAQTVASKSGPIRYACEGRQNLVVERDRDRARVNFIDRSYELKRKPSSIGIKYGSSTAALIIDGHSAVFVADDRLQLGTCTEAFPVAAAE